MFHATGPTSCCRYSGVFFVPVTPVVPSRPVVPCTPVVVPSTPAVRSTSTSVPRTVSVIVSVRFELADDHFLDHARRLRDDRLFSRFLDLDEAFLQVRRRRRTVHCAALDARVFFMQVLDSLTGVSVEREYTRTPPVCTSRLPTSSDSCTTGNA